MGSWLRSAKSVWGATVTIMAAVATYDGISSQLNLRKISSIWGASYQLLPLWGWVALGQLALIAWLAHRVREQSGLHGPVAPIETTKSFERLEKRLVTAQDQLSILLAWKDKLDAEGNPMPDLQQEITNISEAVGSVSVSLKEIEGRTTYNYQIISNAHGEIVKLQTLTSQCDHRARSIIRASVPINANEALLNIRDRLDYLATSVYKGGFTNRLDTSFQPLPYHEAEFDALCQVAADIVAVVPDMRRILDIPSDAGRSLFIPQDEGYLVHSGDSPERTRGYVAAQRRYVHFQIAEFLRMGHGH